MLAAQAFAVSTPLGPSCAVVVLSGCGVIRYAGKFDPETAGCWDYSANSNLQPVRPVRNLVPGISHIQQEANVVPPGSQIQPDLVNHKIWI